MRLKNELNMGEINSCSFLIFFLLLLLHCFTIIYNNRVYRKVEAKIIIQRFDSQFPSLILHSVEG